MHLSMLSRRRLLLCLASVGVLSCITLGVMGKNGWLPSTDPMSGKKTGWFGRELPKNASSSWNPFAAPSPTPTPQLSKEYIYAGSRLLAVEDANANAAPPADLAVWRPSTGMWYVLGGPGSQATQYTWGDPTDFPVPGDFDGDGKTDFSVYRKDSGAPFYWTWYIVNSSDSSTSTITWGEAKDWPAAADYDGDGRTDQAVFRAATGMWYIRQSSTGNMVTQQFGQAGDIPAAADYDGDGKADIGIWRDSDTTFYSLNSSSGTLATATFTSSSTEPVSADYDGDGKANYAIRSGASWIIMNAALSLTSSVTWQQAGDVPVQNDYDGDGKVDIAVWRDSTGHWYIRQSTLLGQSGELRQVQWGVSGDVPVPAYYRR